MDVLSGGRLRLGVGIGWNAVEYARIEEQIEVMRLLCTQEVISYEGDYHRIDEAGINPLPVQRPIPVWKGGRRAAQDRSRDRRLVPAGAARRQHARGH